RRTNAELLLSMTLLARLRLTAGRRSVLGRISFRLRIVANQETGKWQRWHPARPETNARAPKGAPHDDHHHPGRNVHLLQGLGPRPPHQLLAWLAVVGRRVGGPDGVPRQPRLSGDRPRPARPWPLGAALDRP